MDYLEHFGLSEEPFGHAPVPRLYYGSEQHSQALKRLMYAAQTMRGLAVLSGDIGRGKTTLARRMLDLLPESEYEAALLVIVHGGITPNWLLKRVALQLGVTDPQNEKLAILAQLYRRLTEINEQGRKAVVLVDEAQMLRSREIMEEFRGLLNLELPGKKLISFVFFGLPDLERNLALDPPLAQRVTMHYRLETLVAADTANYVLHRLQACGANHEIFSAEALDEIHRWSGGVPRLINTLSDNVLLELFFEGEKLARPEHVAAVADNLNIELVHSSAQAEVEAEQLPEEIPAVEGGPGHDAIVAVLRDDVVVSDTAVSILGISPDAIAAQVATEEDELAVSAAYGLGVDIPVELTDDGAGEDDLAIDIDFDDPEVVPEVGTSLELEVELEEIPVVQEVASAPQPLPSVFFDTKVAMATPQIPAPTTLVSTTTDTDTPPALPATPSKRRKTTGRFTTSAGKVIDLDEIDDFLADLE